MITAGVHLYGSRRGYRTLVKSADVSAAEDAALAGIGFGQANDPRAFAALRESPTAVGRPLASGRFAMTRALPGAPDDAGRPTIVLCTLIFSAADYTSYVRHHLQTLVSNASLWDPARHAGGESVTLRLPAPASRAATELDLRVADAWMQARGHDSAVAALPNGSEEAILALPQVLSLADALAYRWGVRVLGVDAGAEVATLVQGAATGRRRTVPCALSGPYRSKFFEFVARSGSIGSPLPLHDGSTSVQELGVTEATMTPERDRLLRRNVAIVAGAVGAIALAVVLIVMLRPPERHEPGTFNRTGVVVEATPLEPIGDVKAPSSSPSPHSAHVPEAADARDGAMPQPTHGGSGAVSPSATHAQAPVAPAGHAPNDTPPGPEQPTVKPPIAKPGGPDNPSHEPKAPPPPVLPVSPSGSSSTVPSGTSTDEPFGPPAALAPAAPPLDPSDELFRKLLALSDKDRFVEFGADARTAALMDWVAKQLEAIANNRHLDDPLDRSTGWEENVRALGERARGLAPVAASGSRWIDQLGTDRNLTAPMKAILQRLQESDQNDGKIWDSPQEARTVLDVISHLASITQSLEAAQYQRERMSSALKGLSLVNVVEVPHPVPADVAGGFKSVRKRCIDNLSRWQNRVKMLESERKPPPTTPPL